MSFFSLWVRGNPGFGRRWQGGLPLLFLVLLAPASVRAQGTPTLDELELAYQAAGEAYQSALSAREAQNLRLQRALAEADSARASGDDDRENRAIAAATREALELNRWDGEVARTADLLAVARDPYLDALSERVDELVGELQLAQEPGERRELAALLGATNNLYQTILQESFQDPEVELQMATEWNIHRTDTPEDIRRKARAMEVRADQFQVQLALTEERLERLREEQRRVRTIADMLADAQRYDDTRPPVVRPGSRTTDPANPGQVLPPGADTLGAQDRLTLEEQIQGLQALRDRLTDYIQTYRDRAELFRRRAGGEWA